MNLAKLIEGPAIALHRGQVFEIRGGGVLTPEAASFAIETDRFGPIDQRAIENSIAFAFTPIGVWTADILPVLWRWQNPTIGQLVTPVYDIDTIDLVTNRITLIGTVGPRIGCPIQAATFGTLPAPLVEGTLYYVGVPVPATPHIITLHTTEADALAGTNAVDITDAGTSDHTLIEQEPLTIWTNQNRKIVFHNAAITGMPPITFSTVQTLIGQATVECFRKNNVAWSAADSLFTITKSALNVTAPNPTDIPTQEYTMEWGASPWNSWQTRAAFTLTPQLATADITGDQRGIEGKRISGLTVTAQGAPVGFSEQQLLDILGMQGGAVARGKSRTRADLKIVGTGVHVTLRNAAAQQLPQTFSPTDPRAGELAFVASRSPSGTDAFRVATAAE